MCSHRPKQLSRLPRTVLATFTGNFQGCLSERREDSRKIPRGMPERGRFPTFTAVGGARNLPGDCVAGQHAQESVQDAKLQSFVSSFLGVSATACTLWDYPTTLLHRCRPLPSCGVTPFGERGKGHQTPFRSPKAESQFLAPTNPTCNKSAPTEPSFYPSY
jgi:hypothetical protein